MRIHGVRFISGLVAAAMIMEMIPVQAMALPEWPPSALTPSSVLFSNQAIPPNGLWVLKIIDRFRSTPLQTIRRGAWTLGKVAPVFLLLGGSLAKAQSYIPQANG